MSNNGIDIDLESVKENFKNKFDNFINDSETSDQIKKIASNTNEFVQKNPWVAVVGALFIGYLIGSSRSKK